MFAATVAASILVAAALAASAARKLTHAEAVVASYARAGVPETRLDQLAVVLLAGAAGLVVGLWWAPLGIAAAVCVVLYFVVAIGFHVRSGDVANLTTPSALAVAAAITTYLRIATS